MSADCCSGLDTKEKVVAHPKFVDFSPSPAPFTHIRGWKSVCVKGSETGAKLPKIYINLFYCTYWLNENWFLRVAGPCSLGTLGGIETVAFFLWLAVVTAPHPPEFPPNRFGRFLRQSECV